MPTTVALQACRASCLTHARPRSRAACAVYCLLVQRLVLGADDRAEALRLALLDAATHLPEGVGRELIEVRSFSGRGGTGYVLDTLWSAWDAFAAGGSYGDVVERSIRYGHDTDTTACVAGSLAGTFWGLGAIPPDWIQAMRGRDIVEPLVQRLLAFVGGRAAGLTTG
jgi:ADP-ribosylglycohydrolase